MPHNKQKKIAVINDLSGFGRCSISVALPIISAMKIQCCPLPTAILSNHTGFDSFYCKDFTEYMDLYIKEWVNMGLSFNAILTGFLGSVDQISIVKNFLNIFKNKNNFTIIDPVMGDYGKLYQTYSVELANKMKDLVPYADILTPNLTEACILTKTDYKPYMSEKELAHLCEEMSKMGCRKIVISGLEKDDNLENFVYEDGYNPKIVKVHKVGICRSGTGDVFSSIIAADTVNGVDLLSSVAHACEFIEKTLKKTVELDLPITDGICFEEFLTDI
ncbi:MAG: pyridoxamine kinase [Clostridia bacterium]|nr:pyridoxamine kinase [Clostridia bacterium]